MSLSYPFMFAHWAVCSTGLIASLTLTVLLLWLRPTRSPAPAAGWPALTILKPFDGNDDGLADNLWTYLTAHYPAPRQVLLCSDRDNKRGIAAAEQVLARLADRPIPDVDVSLLLSSDGDLAPANRKIWHLQRGLEAARHSVIVSGDSATRLEDTTLPELVATLLAHPRTGLSWAPYTADGEGGLGSRLTRLALSASSLNFFIVALLHRLLRRGAFSAGGLFAIRREALDEVGGFAPFASVLAEDIHLARHLDEQGWQVAISPMPVVQHPGRASLAVFYRRMVRWTFIMWRYKDPLRIHVPMVLCTLPLSLITLPLASLGYPDHALRFAVLTAALWVSRWVYGLVLLTSVGRRAPTADVLWGTPLMELILLVAYFRSLFMRTVRWRSQRLAVEEGGEMTPADR